MATPPEAKVILAWSWRGCFSKSTVNFDRHFGGGLCCVGTGL